ncbi:MAG: NADH-quinone oxidoreductase subunit N [Candidatus Marinimicrobia bacterium]|nr:NADH-quinone oxidoreductase subunit N [Candidatus Neomarinimicrobiota bacterium]
MNRDMVDFQINPADFNLLLPEIVLSIGAMLMLFMELFLKGKETLHQWTAFTTFIIAFSLLLSQNVGGVTGFSMMVRSDLFGQFFSAIVLIGGGLTVLLGKAYFVSRDWHRGEYYSLLLFASVGMLFMVRGLDLLVIFLGLELLSISLYILVGYFRDRLFSNEAALKYLLLGAFASGFLLFGIAYIYGSYGTTNLYEIRAMGSAESVTFYWIGLSLILVGFSFKVALVPFHMWSPDVYQGAPTPVTGFMATTTKAAAFAAMMRILFYGFPAENADWTPLFWFLSAVTMTVGNIFAIQQSNLKRMLAYSSIAHAGYLMIGITVGSEVSSAGMLFYLFGYLFMNIGAFAVVQHFEGIDETRLDFESYSGLAKKHPAISLAMTLFMLALAGFPLTVGFTGKFYIFTAAINQGFVWLILIAVINSLISIYYYLRVIIYMFMKPVGEEIEISSMELPTKVALTVCVYAVLHLGILPGNFITLAKEAVSALF